VLHPTNYVNFKEMLISTPAFGNNKFQFCQNTASYLLALQLAVCTAVQAAVGTATSS